MNRFAKMKKERIYTLFETLSKMRGSRLTINPPPVQGGAEGDNWEAKKIKSAVSCSWDLKLTKLFLPVQFIK